MRTFHIKNGGALKPRRAKPKRNAGTRNTEPRAWNPQRGTPERGTGNLEPGTALRESECIPVLVDVHLLEGRRLAESGHPLHVAAERYDEAGTGARDE